MGLVVIVNAGSSSLKISLIDPQNKDPVWEGEVFEKIPSREKVIAVGHRIVHGGPLFFEPTPITDEVLEKLESLVEMAPLHLPAHIEGIYACRKLLPALPEYAVFDTAFHRTLPEVAYTYPGPYSWKEKNIRKYGFHGISYAYLARHLDLTGKTVICHLGAGASLCALQDGVSIDTTMGLTPLDGLMMATRSGSIDPSIVFLLQAQGEDVEEVLNHASGLLGISELSSDLRVILQHQGNPQAQLAYDLFLFHLKKGIGEMVASLEGIDKLIFTAGIGENAPSVRAETVRSLAYLGAQLDATLNEQEGDRIISKASSKIEIRVIHTHEDWEIVAQLSRFLNPTPTK